MAGALTSWRILLAPVKADLSAESQPSSLTIVADALRGLDRRRTADRSLPLPADPAWSMLLSLYVAAAANVIPSVSDLCATSGAPLSTAFRVILRMEDLHMIMRVPDPSDHRRSLVVMGEATHAALSNALTGVEAAVSAPLR